MVNSLSLRLVTPPSSSVLRHKPQFAASQKPLASCSPPSSSSVRSAHPRLSCFPPIFSPQPSALGVSYSPLAGSGRNPRVRTGLAAAVDDQTLFARGINVEESVFPEVNDDDFGEEEPKKLGKPCEVYVSNIPRSCDTAQLLEMFKPHGTILSAEVCRNAKTGESKGCGYVKMESTNSARNAVAALDGSDVGGREMRVRFSVEMNDGGRNPDTMNSSPKRVLYYESPHKLYVGNLARAVRPEELAKLFSRFGTVVSGRVLHDYKQGKGRVYAFLSFLSEAERDAAMSLNGTVFNSRTLVVREGIERTEP